VFSHAALKVASASEGLFSIISEVIIKFDVEARTASNRLLHACIMPASLPFPPL
jgi:hypothetical protein